MIRLNLGCGIDLRPGFINIDARSDVGAELVQDINDPLPYSKQSVHQVVAQDVLEHLTVEQQKRCLRDIYRVLRIGGRLEVRIPNLETIWTKFSEDPDTRNLYLYGDTTHSGVWGAHKSGHTKQSFVTLCIASGFKLISVLENDTNYEFVLEKSNQPAIKHLLFINQSLGIGGAETFNSQLLAWLVKQGVEVTAYVTHPYFAKTLQVSNIQTYLLGVVLDVIGNWKGLVKALVLWPWAVMQYTMVVLRNRHVDVILMTGFIEKILVTPIAKILGIAVVWVEFAPLSPIFRKFAGLPKSLYRLVSSLPDYLIEPTQYTRTHNAAILGVSAGRTLVIPCGIAVSSDYLRIKSEKNLVCCVSRLEAGKGQDLLLDAWGEVVKMHPQAKLKIIGEGGEYRNLKSQITNLKLTQSVELLGYVQDALAEMAKASVIVFPSCWSLEGFGMVAVEAMALARPIVVFKVGPLAEIVDSQVGVVVPVVSRKDLVQAINFLLSHPPQGRQLGKHGRDKYLSRYTLDVVGPQYLDVLNLAYCRRQAHIWQ